MSEPLSRQEKEYLADLLRREARDRRPAFSEELHARLCHAVERCEAGKLSATAPRRGARGKLMARWAFAAAACVLGAATLVWQWGRGVPTDVSVESPQDVAPVAANDTPLPAALANSPSDVEVFTEMAEQAGQRLADLLDSAQRPQQWSTLDRDARSALQSLADRIPLDVPQLLASSEPTDGPLPDQGEK
jgi:hypothetical protein